MSTALFRLPGHNPHWTGSFTPSAQAGRIIRLPGHKSTLNSDSPNSSGRVGIMTAGPSKSTSGSGITSDVFHIQIPSQVGMFITLIDNRHDPLHSSPNSNGSSAKTNR
ncbi:hypothetical protein AVEN_120504-1 [Araneus ventricosus]|uniref:Uncharacterized protein n=1 Tax=Araneus ventricosus TaxID=182803 RepID=A0A4Y2X808_ARAVE|nr:hypothetical protein AVEN_120504-1 [Araneus ventricosus]